MSTHINNPLPTPVTPQNGGTGIANNSASTITISGSFGTTFTITGTTGVTFPTSGTLATLAGSEELTNKTLTSSVGKGTWTASGTWTLPAITLGGTVSGGGQQLNNIIIGTSTPLAGSFTTLGASGITSLTNATDASALGTAAVVLTGGLSVAKKIQGGDDINVAAGFGYRVGGGNAYSYNATSNSVRIGPGAGAALNNASSANTAIGLNALNVAANTTSDQVYENLAVGNTALVALTTGAYNMGLGSNAGQNLTTGYGNAFVGRQAGYVFQTGQYNVAIGYLAGGSGASNYSGSHNIILGDQVAHASDLSNAVNIGNVIKATGTSTGSTLGGAVFVQDFSVAGVAGFGIATSSSTFAAYGAGTTAISSLRIPHGAAPTSPVNGDMWTTTAGLFIRINGSTVGPLS